MQPYVPYALLALGAYTLVGPLVSFVTREIPSDVAALVTNSMFAVGAGAVILYRGGEVLPYLDHPKAPYLYLAGLCLTVGLLAYYRALSLGPVSVVVPIFGLFIVTSAVVGIAFLDEALTARKVTGIALAMVAVYLTTVE